MSEKTLQDLAVKMHERVHELVKKYQFRDRNQICCYDISVSQCYVMYEIKESPLPMRALSDRMHLDISTMTRVVDQLEKKRYIRRSAGKKDRRSIFVSLTDKGREILDRIESGLIETERAILQKISPEARESVLFVLEELLNSVERWRQACCVPKKPANFREGVRISLKSNKM